MFFNVFKICTHLKFIDTEIMVLINICTSVTLMEEAALKTAAWDEYKTH